MIPVPLVIGGRQLDEIQRCVAHAQAHPVRIREVLRRGKAHPRAVPIGADPAFVVEFPLDCTLVMKDGDTRPFSHPAAYTAVFSIEQALKYEDGSFGWLRHLSVSCAAPGRAPNVPAMDMLLPLYGFRRTFANADGWRHLYFNTYTEDIGAGKIAVNVTEEMDEGEGPPGRTDSTNPGRLEL